MRVEENKDAPSASSWLEEDTECTALERSCTYPGALQQVVHGQLLVDLQPVFLHLNLNWDMEVFTITSLEILNLCGLGLGVRPSEFSPVPFPRFQSDLWNHSLDPGSTVSARCQDPGLFILPLFAP